MALKVDLNAKDFEILALAIARVRAMMFTLAEQIPS